jgi:tetratricopeptide (TPR) repeat protein
MAYAMPVFKTGAIGHSATPPANSVAPVLIISQTGRQEKSSPGRRIRFSLLAGIHGRGSNREISENRSGSCEPAMRILLVAILLLLILLSFGLGGYFAYHWAWGAEAHRRAAEISLDQGDFRAATDHLTEFLADRPNSLQGHLLLARSLRRAIQPVLPTEWACGPSALLNAPEGSASSYDQVENHLADYRRLGGLPEVSQLEHYLLQAQQGNLAGVESRLLSLIDHHHPDTLMIREALIKGYLLTFRLLDASNCLTQWLDERVDFQALLWRGWVRERLKDPDNAVADYERALELVPAHVEVRLRLADALLTTFQPEKAQAHYEYLDRDHPGAPALLLGLARCSRELGQTDKARRSLDDLLRQEPRNVAALTERAKIALADDQPAQAEEWLRRALALVPCDQEVNYVFAQCLKRRGNIDEFDACVARLEQIKADYQEVTHLIHQVLRSPRDPALRCRAGTLLLKNGFKEEGLRWLYSALREVPNHLPTHRVLADHFQQDGDRERAAAHRRLASRLEGTDLP